MTPAILITPRGTNLPIVERLAATRKYDLISFNDLGPESIKSYGLKTFESFFDPEKDGPALNGPVNRQLAQMLPAFDLPAFAVSFKKYFPGHNGLHQRLAERFKGILVSAVPQAFHFFKCLERVVSEHNLRLLITHDTVSYHWRTLALHAQSLGIPVLYLPHAPGNAISDVSRANATYLDIYTEKVVVANEIERRQYLEAGVAEEKLALTGHPHFDDHFLFAQVYYSNVEKYRREVCASFGLPTDSKIIVFYTAWTNDFVLRPAKDSLLLETFEKVAGAVKRVQEEACPNVALVIKFHPNIKQMKGGPNAVIKAHQEVSKRIGLRNGHAFYRPDSIGNKELLAIADLVLTTRSTIILESLFMRTPVILLEEMAEGREVIEGLVPEALTSEDLAAAAGKILMNEKAAVMDQPGFHEAWPRLAYNLDGRAVERVMTVIEEMVS